MPLGLAVGRAQLLFDVFCQANSTDLLVKQRLFRVSHDWPGDLSTDRQVIYEILALSGPLCKEILIIEECLFLNHLRILNFVPLLHLIDLGSVDIATWRPG
jgi:hypothetical protein